MSTLLIPIAPLSRTKSRLRDCFSKELLKELTIAMFNDLAKKVSSLDYFDPKIVYCNSDEILSLAREYGLLGIKEELSTPRKTFDQVIQDLNTIAITQYNANSTIFTFLDVILISETNLKEINELLKINDLVVCPAIHSGGISILGRNPPDIIPTYFSEPRLPSFVALLNNARLKTLKFAIYDSFRAGFDIDLKQDLILAYEYLKIFNLEKSETYKFLKNNLKLTLYKKNVTNNRRFEIKKVK
jgi:2-phospho-L-lactate guanylyltransferase (CobY/MobA/RfbA family)